VIGLNVERLPAVGELASRIHNTLVSPEASWNEIEAFCRKSVEYKFCAVVVQGCRATKVKGLLKGSSTRLSAGVGFPMGGSITKVKLVEIKEAIIAGADQFDYMANIGYLKSGMYDEFRQEMTDMVTAAYGRPVSAMLEFSVLSLSERVEAAVLAE